MPRPRMNEDEFRQWQDYKRLKKEAEEMDVFPPSVKHAWIKTKDTSLFCTNPDYEQPTFDPDKIDWEFIIKDVAKPDEQIYTLADKCNAHFDRLVMTDWHIGMTTNKSGYSLYGGKWDESTLYKRMIQIVEHCRNNQQSNKLIIHDLGDLMDGWNGMTVRQQHSLPQNMDNQKAFDVGLRFKRVLIDLLLQYYKEISIVNICSDNHSGSFGYIVNSAFKTLIETIYTDRISVTNQRKFIDHYRHGNNIFILTHGKDDINLKFGFPVYLDSSSGVRAKTKIDEYIDEFCLWQPNVHIEFCKGDSHQALYDECSSQRFFYYNYPAGSDASEWVQTNYKKGRSGVVFYNYWDEDEPMSKSEHKLWFKWKR